MTKKAEQAITEKLNAVFPAGVPVGMFELITGDRVDNNAYATLQRMEEAGRAEIVSLQEHLRELAEVAAHEERAYADTRNKLDRSQATMTDGGLLAGYIARGLANERIRTDNERETAEATERLQALETKQRHLSALVRLAHVRAGHASHSAGLAADFGVEVDDLLTDRERRKLDDARRAEIEIEKARKAEQERTAAIARQHEKERAVERLKEQAEADEVDGLTPTQWLSIIFEKATPSPEVVRMLDGRGSWQDRATALQTLNDRQSWPSYTLAQRRACALLFEHISGQAVARA